MFWISARIVPNAGLRVTLSAATRTSAPSTATRVPSSTCTPSSPFGPLTRTRPSSTSTVTPPGIETGFLPTRDMAYPLPDVAHELAPEARFARLAVGHDALRCGQDRGAEAAHHLRDAVLGHVHAAPGGAHALESRDHRRLVLGVLEIDPQHALTIVLDDLVVVDETLAQQHFGELRLEAARGHVHLAVLRADRISNPGEEIRHRIT